MSIVGPSFPATVAQSAEHLTRNEDVRGSIPRGGSTRISGDPGMESIRDYFECDKCGNRRFNLVYTFSLRFHGVNFSDQLIYDKIKEELYQCAECRKTFSRDEIEEGLNRITSRRRKK